MTAADPNLTAADPNLTAADPALTAADPALTAADPALTAGERAFLRARLRPAVCAGLSYPADPVELRAFFDALFRDAPPPRADGRLCGILAPHIDLSVGAHAYVAPFRQLRAADFDCCVILGTSHEPAGEELFALTEKDFATPLGTARTDRRLARRLRELVAARGEPGALAPGDLAFRIEHSIEFPVLFLQYLYGGALPPLLPVLCNSFDHFLVDEQDPAQAPACAAFLDAFRAALRETGARPMYVVSVDWSHVGRKFGHEVDAGDVLELVRRSDREQLAALARCDLRGFRELLAATWNATLIDGFSCISVFAELAAPQRGTLLSWDLWHEEERRSAVTFAGMAFYRDHD